MKDRLIKWFSGFNAFLIRTSNGKVGSRLGTQSILILHTQGRRTGAARATPVAFFDFEGKYLLVASNWGRRKQAGWLLNLRAQPQARIDVNGKSISVNAREAQGREYERLWQLVTLRHSQYLRHQRMTVRQIPIVILHPVK